MADYVENQLLSPKTNSTIENMTSTEIYYTHTPGVHTPKGISAAMDVMFANGTPSSLLDVGCGTGTWMRAAMEKGVPLVEGWDGLIADEKLLAVPPTSITQLNFDDEMPTKQRYEVVLCLEVAEHLDGTLARKLVSTLTELSDIVYFSAAAPGQHGQHHVNCQWPAFWQQIFNSFGFACDDTIRWKLWNQELVQPWYKQNMFLARRERDAGTEPRLNAVIHPDMLTLMIPQSDGVAQICAGTYPLTWYLTTPVKALVMKSLRFLCRKQERLHPKR